MTTSDGEKDRRAKWHASARRGDQAVLSNPTLMDNPHEDVQVVKDGVSAEQTPIVIQHVVDVSPAVIMERTDEPEHTAEGTRPEVAATVVSEPDHASVATQSEVATTVAIQPEHASVATQSEVAATVANPLAHASVATQSEVAATVANQPDHAQEVTGNERLEEVLGSGFGDESDNSGPKKRARTKKVQKVDPRITENFGNCGPFAGGPGDNKLLKSFYDHIALKIWLGQERPPLRCLNHTKALHEWKIDKYNSRFMHKLRSTGLDVLWDALPMSNKSLVSAMVERWQPETSSFHLPFGEMTITLDDVKQITGLPIEGEMLHNYVIEDIEKGVDLVKRTLGLDSIEVRKEFKLNNGQMCVRMVRFR